MRNACYGRGEYSSHVRRRLIVYTISILPDKMSKKRSPIWCFYTIGGDNDRHAKCNECGTPVPRGGSAVKSFTTTNLVNHLKSKHKDLHQQYIDKKESMVAEAIARSQPSTSTSRQVTIAESIDRTRAWSTNDARALAVSRKIGEMIARDSQPYSIVSDCGFTALLKVLEPRYNLPSRKYITDKVIPEIESDVRGVVKDQMKDVEWFSFTSDIWSTEVSNDSLQLIGLLNHLKRSVLCYMLRHCQDHTLVRC